MVFGIGKMLAAGLIAVGVVVGTIAAFDPSGKVSTAFENLKSLIGG